MLNINNIIEFISSESGCPKSKINENSDLNYDLKICGDDFHELIEKYSEKYKVNLDNYLWHYHSEEEVTFNLIPSRTKTHEVIEKYIPVTPIMLLEFAKLKSWNLSYNK